MLETMPQDLNWRDEARHVTEGRINLLGVARVVGDEPRVGDSFGASADVQ